MNDLDRRLVVELINNSIVPSNKNNTKFHEQRHGIAERLADHIIHNKEKPDAKDFTWLDFAEVPDLQTTITKQFIKKKRDIQILHVYLKAMDACQPFRLHHCREQHNDRASIGRTGSKIICPYGGLFLQLLMLPYTVYDIPTIHWSPYLFHAITTLFPFVLERLTIEAMLIIFRVGDNTAQSLIHACKNSYVKRTSLESGSLFLFNQPVVRYLRNGTTDKSFFHYLLKDGCPRDMLKLLLHETVKPFGEGLHCVSTYMIPAGTAALFVDAEIRVQKQQQALCSCIDQELNQVIALKDIVTFVKSYLVLQWSFVGGT